MAILMDLSSYKANISLKKKYIQAVFKKEKNI